MLRLSGKGVTARGTKPKALGRRTGVRNDLRLMNYKCNRIWVRRDENENVVNVETIRERGHGTRPKAEGFGPEDWS